MNHLRTVAFTVVCLTPFGCAPADDAPPADDTAAATPDAPTWAALQQPGDRLFAVEGLVGPEAVKYDADQDVYFISNFGDAPEDDANDGFISRVSAGTGDIESLRWATAPDETPLFQPRGMALDGDRLWVADAEGLHAFDRTTGAHLEFVDMTALEPGFLNDIAVGADGSLYVTDTGTSMVYRVTGGEAAVAVEGASLGNPNGIAWDAAGQRFLLVPWQGGDSLRAWDPVSGEITIAARSPGARFDGVEPVPGGFLVASQADSALHVVVGQVGRPVIKVPGGPADIAIDTNRGRVAVPYIALNRVDVFQLPTGPATGGN